MICIFYKQKSLIKRSFRNNTGKKWFNLKLSYRYRDIDKCMGRCRNGLIERQVNPRIFR